MVTDLPPSARARKRRYLCSVPDIPDARFFACSADANELRSRVQLEVTLSSTENYPIPKGPADPLPFACENVCFPVWLLLNTLTGQHAGDKRLVFLRALLDAEPARAFSEQGLAWRDSGLTWPQGEARANNTIDTSRALRYSITMVCCVRFIGYLALATSAGNGHDKRVSCLRAIAMVGQLLLRTVVVFNPLPIQ